MSDLIAKIDLINERIINVWEAEQNLWDCQQDTGVANRRLQARINGLWTLATLGGAVYVWSTWNSATSLQAKFDALLTRQWTPYEMGAVGGYAALIVAMTFSAAIADSIVGRASDIKDLTLIHKYDNLEYQLTYYLTQGAKEDEGTFLTRLGTLSELEVKDSPYFGRPLLQNALRGMNKVKVYLGSSPPKTEKERYTVSHAKSGFQTPKKRKNQSRFAPEGLG
jgi:hypothetical protein